MFLILSIGSFACFCSLSDFSSHAPFLPCHHSCSPAARLLGAQLKTIHTYHSVITIHNPHILNVCSLPSCPHTLPTLLWSLQPCSTLAGRSAQNHSHIPFRGKYHPHILDVCSLPSCPHTLPTLLWSLQPCSALAGHSDRCSHQSGKQWRPCLFRWVGMRI